VVTGFLDKGSIYDAHHIRCRRVSTGGTLRRPEETNTSPTAAEIFEKTSVQRAVKQLKLQPYQFQSVHELQQQNTATRIQYYH
jgi:hypothetical protein